MTIQDFSHLMPLFTPAAGAVLLMLSIALYRRHGLAYGLTLVVLALTAILAVVIPVEEAHPMEPLLIVDAFSNFYIAVLAAAALLITVMSYPYLRDLPEQREEYYLLILLGVLGGGILVSARHFVSFFLGLELLSVSLYVLIGYLVKSRDRSVEAGIKYLVPAGAASGILLFGMALLFFDLGRMGFEEIGAALKQGVSLLALAGLGLMVAGIAFKLALAPFHMWTADVYEGAAAPVSAYVATVSKGAVVGLLLRFYQETGGAEMVTLSLLFAILAAASMLAGNLLALLQENVKRILAYSSIAHLGYLLVALLAGGPVGVQAATFYLLAYIITILSAFGMLSFLSAKDAEEPEQLDQLRGLFWRQPGPAAVMTAAMLSLAGIPLTGGFMGKFYLVAAGVQSELWWLLVILVVSSVIGLFYYLRVVAAMFSGAEVKALPALRLFSWGGLVLTILLLLTLWIGLAPESWMGWVSNVVQ